MKMGEEDFRAVAESLISPLKDAALQTMPIGQYGSLFDVEEYRRAAIEILAKPLGKMYIFGRTDERNGRSLQMPDADRSMPKKRLSYPIDEDESYC